MYVTAGRADIQVDDGLQIIAPPWTAGETSSDSSTEFGPCIREMKGEKISRWALRIMLLLDGDGVDDAPKRDMHDL